MAKSGDVVVVPLGTLVAVLETGNVHVKIPTKDTGRPSEDFEIVEFSQDYLRYVKLSGPAPSHPIAVPPGAPGSPTNPIVLPGTPSHPIATPPARPDAGLPPSPGHPDAGLPAAPGHPDAGLPTTPGAKPSNPIATPPGTTKPVPPAEPKK